MRNRGIHHHHLPNKRHIPGNIICSSWLLSLHGSDSSPQIAKELTTNIEKFTIIKIDRIDLIIFIDQSTEQFRILLCCGYWQSLGNRGSAFQFCSKSFAKFHVLHPARVAFGVIRPLLIILSLVSCLAFEPSYCHHFPRQRYRLCLSHTFFIAIICATISAGFSSLRLSKASRYGNKRYDTST